MSDGLEVERQGGLKLARVLLVDSNPAARLTVQTVLEAGGYAVQAASTPDEAVDKLQESQYELVLSDLDSSAPEDTLEFLAHAKQMTYEPAMALLTTSWNKAPRQGEEAVLIEPENVPELLTKVAELIGLRALRQVQRQLLQTQS
jgi:CheY-like chemotaxis protein